MSYAGWEDYRACFPGGVIESETAFAPLAARADAFLDYYTQGRAASAAGSRPLTLACCAIAERLGRLEAARAAALRAYGPDAVQSEKVGDFSRTWRDGAADARAEEAAAERALAAEARRYLAGTGLCSRAGRPGCFRIR